MFLPDNCRISDQPDMAAFISYFDPEDMRRKLDEILSSRDYIA